VETRSLTNYWEACDPVESSETAPKPARFAVGKWKRLDIALQCPNGETKEAAYNEGNGMQQMTQLHNFTGS